MKLLIVEDHPKLRENIIKFFTMKGHLIEWAVHGEEALEKLEKASYDGIILDINLPVMDGREFLKELRKKDKNTPVIALTSNSMLSDKLQVFDLWADDYLTKPFELLELEARVNSLGRRKEKEIEEIIEIWNVKIDIMKHKVFKWTKEVEVWNKEFLIIEFLMKNKWIPKSKPEIFEFAWGEREENLNFDSITLEVHISYIRKKFWRDFIKTIKGVWYVIE
jgi:DNA-binding response OmpR family regulator